MCQLLLPAEVKTEHSVRYSCSEANQPPSMIADHPNA